MAISNKINGKTINELVPLESVAGLEIIPISVKDDVSGKYRTCGITVDDLFQKLYDMFQAQIEIDRQHTAEIAALHAKTDESDAKIETIGTSVDNLNESVETINTNISNISEDITEIQSDVDRVQDSTQEALITASQAAVSAQTAMIAAENAQESAESAQAAAEDAAAKAESAETNITEVQETASIALSYSTENKSKLITLTSDMEDLVAYTTTEFAKNSQVDTEQEEDIDALAYLHENPFDTF